jgi:hypothetical protein
MPWHRRSVYSNSARFADLGWSVCHEPEYKPVLVVVYYWIGIRIGVGVDTEIGIDTTCLWHWTIRIEPFLD